MIKLSIENANPPGEKPGLLVRAEDSRLRDRGFGSCRILVGCKRC
jgi:hypothetical protein